MLGLLGFQVLISLASSLDIFENNCLQATNQLRRRHGVPDLTWSNTLAADAQAWANRLANSNVFQHDYISMQAKNQGENLAYFKPFKRKCQGPKRDDCVQCAEIVDDWYDEVKNYDFDLGKAKTPSGVVMHFTQEVWKKSHQFGIGTAKSKKYGFILVARYSPRGNGGGPMVFKDNVFPPGTISDPTPSTSPSATPPAPTSITQNIKINISINTSTMPTSAPSKQGGGKPTTPSVTTTSPPQVTLPAGTLPPGVSTTKPTKAPGSGKNESDKCQYFVVNSTTYTYAIVQKCKGKPNVTFVPQVPPKPCEPNPCKNGATCEVLGGLNFTCICPQGYSGQLCQERGPSEEEIKDALMLTNLYRAMHQAPPVIWSKEMAAKAQDWADKLAREQRLVHENESSADYGENLAEVGGDDKALLRAIDAWYKEFTNYNFNDPTFTTDTGHFSQLVWGATNQFAMAKAKARDVPNVYVVARYKPAGNVVNQFQMNVKPKPQ